MKLSSEQLGWLVVAGVLCHCVRGQGAEGSAPGRLRIEKSAESPWPASAGAVEIWPSIPGSGKFSVTAVDGKPVHWQRLWSAVGQPALIRFDTSSGATAYHINFDTNAAAPAGIWNPEAGVLLETRGCADLPMNTLEQVNRLVGAAEIQGRSFVPDIFQGINPHGPSTHYVALFSGWFNVRQAGRYEFATISSGASYLQIDGRMVAEWLGRHDVHGGRRGEHSGGVALKPGAHRIDYVQVQLESGPAAIAAWRPPGQERFEVMPPSAFLPLGRFRATSFEAPRSSPEQVYVEWNNLEHCLLADSLTVKTRFHVVEGGRRRSYKWRFDDGDEAAGADVQHIFPQGGMRQVTVQAYEGPACVATNTLRVRVRPHWPQREDWRQGLFQEARGSFLRRDLSRMPARDLGEVLDLADRLEDRELMMRAGQAMLQRQDEFNTPAYGQIFFKLGLNLQRQGDQGDRLAEQALRAALTPERNNSATANKVKVWLAEVLIHCDGNLDEGEKVLGSVFVAGLSPDERRLAKLLQGDVQLARGNVEGAKQLYAAAGNLPKAPGGGSRVARAAVLESASISLQRGEYEEAESTLNRLVYGFPLERLSLDAGLLRANLSLKQKEYRRAFELCRALSDVAGRDPQKADLLRGMVESGLALGKRAEAQQALRELLKSFPYSEAAAKAKEQWEARRG